jgi:serine/threonine protein kinase
MEVEKVLREGQQFARYRIIHLLKSGGMGEVYLADDVQLRRHVAIKVIRADSSLYSDLGAEQEAARLFQREMQAIGQLDHRHILPVYDSGEEDIDGTIFMYMVMPVPPEGSLTLIGCANTANRGESRLAMLSAL